MWLVGKARVGRERGPARRALQESPSGTPEATDPGKLLWSQADRAAEASLELPLAETRVGREAGDGRAALGVDDRHDPGADDGVEGRRIPSPSLDQRGKYGQHGVNVLAGGVWSRRQEGGRNPQGLGGAEVIPEVGGVDPEEGAPAIGPKADSGKTIARVHRDLEGALTRADERYVGRLSGAGKTVGE